MPDLGADTTMALTVGKMENPFVFSDLVFDGDYTPEGIGLQLGRKLNDRHSLKFLAGGFVLDEIGSLSTDPYLYGGQIRWDAAWNKKVSSSAGIAGLNIVHDENLSNTGVPNVNRGNTRQTFISNGSTNQVPAFNFNPIIADAAVTYAFDSFAGYPGAFPVRLGGDFIYNPAAPDAVDNYGYSIGITFGKAGRKGAWEVGYTWKWLGSDAWWEEMVDSDFGAFYGGTLPLSGTSAGYGSGTNVKGHILRAAYSPYDTVTLSVKWLHTDLINPVTVANSTMNRVQVDASWKF
jgi:hypothetical protein